MKKYVIFIIALLIFFISFKEKIFNQANYNKYFNNIETCKIEEINEIPIGSTIIVGHAYGSPNNNENEFLSEKIEKFLDQNPLIKAVIFTGDVFKYPTIEKWNRLKKIEITQKIEIYVAPGNHDVGFGENSSLDIFKNSKISPFEYPFSTILNNKNIIIDNSSSNGWQINQKTYDLVKNNPSKNYILFIHHIILKDLLYLANSKQGIPDNLLSFDDLRNLNLTIISGDSGAFINLPRISCHKKGSLKYITNGIGDIDGDIILVLNNSKIYSYKLK